MRWLVCIFAFCFAISSTASPGISRLKYGMDYRLNFRVGPMKYAPYVKTQYPHQQYLELEGASAELNFAMIYNHFILVSHLSHSSVDNSSFSGSPNYYYTKIGGMAGVYAKDASFSIELRSGLSYLNGFLKSKYLHDKKSASGRIYYSEREHNELLCLDINAAIHYDLGKHFNLGLDHSAGFTSKGYFLTGLISFGFRW